MYTSQLKTARATVILAITFTLAVWSSPIRPVIDGRYGNLQPAWIFPHTYIPAVYYHGFSSPYIYPIVRQPIHGFYALPIDIQQPLHPFNYNYPSSVRQDLDEFNGMDKELYNTRMDVNKDDVIVSSLEQIPREPNFSDKSLMFSFLNHLGLPNRLVQRISSFPFITLTYKNITLNGIEIG